MPHQFFCLNPDCLQPDNHPQSRFCVACGSPTTSNGQAYSFLNGKYLVKNFLAQGAFGRTYQAIATNRPNHPCVIKKITVNFVPPQNLAPVCQTFEQKAKQLLTLKHPQLQEFHHYLSYNLKGSPSLYFVQEWIEGKNLELVWQTLGNFSSEQVRSILLRLLPALNYLHDHGIFHGNITPRNIILQASTRKLVLTDFGRTVETVCGATRITSVSGYGAIEQTLGKTCEASDLYSLAATCVRLMTGALPSYDPLGNLATDPIYDVWRGEWRWRHHLEKEGIQLPSDLTDVLENLLQPFAADRYQTASEVLHILQKYRIVITSGKKTRKTSPPQQPVQAQVTQVVKTAGKAQNNANFLGKLKQALQPEAKSPQAAPTSVKPKTPQKTVPPTVLQSKSPPRATMRQPAPNLYQNFVENLGNGIGIEMVAIPAGSFQDALGNIVKIANPFYIGKYPITQAQWQTLMGNNPAFCKGQNHPVECVTWDDCQTFLNKLKQKTGKRYRLPSEAEWEYACRAATNQQSLVTTYYFGDDEKLLDEYGWHRDNSDNKTHPVGQKKPNQFGLYDMHGNVREWCEDDWVVDYSLPRKQEAYKNKQGKNKVVRSGSWVVDPSDCCSAYRSWWSPDCLSHDLGLRVVMSFAKP